MSKKRTREDNDGGVEDGDIVEGNSVGNEEEERRKKSPKLSSEQPNDQAGDEQKQEGTAIAKTEQQDEVNKEEEGIAKGEESVKKKGEAEVETDAKEETDKEKKVEEEKKKENNETGKGDVEDKKEEKKESKSTSGHVFGSGSSFGSTFGSIPQKNVFASDDKENKDTKEDAGAKKPVFGSGFAFGSSSFTSEKKENIFDSAPQEEAKKEEEDSNEDTPEASKETYAKVEQPLQEKKIETGEEGEQSVFSCRAKLYTLDLTKPSEGWRERGVGTLHVNTTQESRSRLVMRADGVLKVILNLPLLSGFEVHSGMNSSLSGEKFVRVNCIQENKPLQYALRTSNAEISKQLFEEIKKLIPAE